MMIILVKALCLFIAFLIAWFAGYKACEERELKTIIINYNRVLEYDENLISNLKKSIRQFEKILNYYEEMIPASKHKPRPPKIN